MSFVLNTPLAEAKLIPGERINLKLLLSNEDYEELKALAEKNFKDDYIKTLYGQRPETVGFDHTKYQISCKFSRNRGYKEDQTRFTRLYYVIKLKPTADSETDKIIGTFEVYSCYEGVEFGLFIDQDHAHQYYGTEALNTVIKFLQENSTIKKAKWECFADNKGSVGVAEKCGFVYAGGSRIYGDRMSSCHYLDLTSQVPAD